MKKMTISLVVLGTALSAQPAFAEAFNGPYVGIEGSHDSYEIKANETSALGAQVSFDGLSGNGKAAGIYAGYDVPVSEHLFVGAEANFNYSGAGISISGVITQAQSAGTAGIGTLVVADPAPTESTLAVSLKARESYGLAGRIGAKFGSTGLYGKVGYLRTRFKASGSATGLESGSVARTEDAFVYGGGLQTALTEKFSVRAEFTVSDYGNAGLNADFGSNGIKVSNSKTSVGLLYKF